MKKLTYVVIGAGSRGTSYMRHAHNQGNMELIAIADPMDRRRNAARDLYDLPEERCYHHWDDLFAQGKIADFAMICTQDQMHLEPALKAIELGYDLLLEKPVAPNPQDCMKICEAAEKKGVKVLVCHVLRYTPFWRTVKKFIDDGKLGKIMSIVHVEGVGNVHQSHSFVRGPWANSNTSAPMLLAKSCHDIDLLQWLLDSRCTKAQSFGRLSYFTKENCPKGAPERCMDGCPHGETCPYNAVKIYREGRENGWYAGHAAHTRNPSAEDMEEVLKNTEFGKCVFQVDNNVVDHQVVNLEYENGETVSFTMAAFNKGGRRVHIMGTKGELISTDSDTIQLYTFCDEDRNSETYGQPRMDTIKTSELNMDESIAGGHGGGDTGIIGDLYKLLSEGGIATRSVSDIRTSVMNHLTVFAAEESRNQGGQVVDVAEYVHSLNF